MLYNLNFEFSDNKKDKLTVIIAPKYGEWRHNFIGRKLYGTKSNIPKDGFGWYPGVGIGR